VAQNEHDRAQAVLYPVNKMTPGGFEHAPKSSGITDILDKGGANCGAVGGDSAPVGHSDPDLSAVVRAWPGLSAEQRRAVLGIVADAGG
jgi:hypothetical protein